MQLGGLAGMTALTMGLGQERGNGHKAGEIKKQMDDATHVEAILNRTELENNGVSSVSTPAT
jgi:hypothetical protein